MAQTRKQRLPRAEAAATWRWFAAHLNFTQATALMELVEEHDLQCIVRRSPRGTYRVNVKFGGLPSVAHESHQAFQRAVTELMPSLSDEGAD